MLDILPAHVLTFGIRTTPPHPDVSITLTNRSNDRAVAFKFKTTCVQRYLVVPNQGLVPPAGCIQVRITLHHPFGTPLPKDARSDHFRVQSMLLETEVYEQVKDWCAEDRNNALRQLWMETTKDHVSLYKLRCHFVYCGASDEISPPSYETAVDSELSDSDYASGQESDESDLDLLSSIRGSIVCKNLFGERPKRLLEPVIPSLVPSINNRVLQL